MLICEQKGRHAVESLWHCCVAMMCQEIPTLMTTSAASGPMQVVRLLLRRKGMADSLNATAWLHLSSWCHPEPWAGQYRNLGRSFSKAKVP